LVNTANPWLIHLVELAVFLTLSHSENSRLIGMIDLLQKVNIQLNVTATVV